MLQFGRFRKSEYNKDILKLQVIEYQCFIKTMSYHSDPLDAVPMRPAKTGGRIGGSGGRFTGSHLVTLGVPESRLLSVALAWVQVISLGFA